MSTTRDELVGFVDTLYIPKIASGFTTSAIRASQEAIETSILLFASGQGDKQPDLVGWMEKQKLLDTAAFDNAKSEGLMVDGYRTRQTDVDTKKAEMDQQGTNVKDTTFSTFNLSNATYVAVKERFGQLDRISAVSTSVETRTECNCR
ncbi:hypothetical protein [Nocardia sp. NBC_01009]|uniref:hypothetical protein n=1 Tax=Nocardia sp. NBC_01009 TaxID=2975996 RepID=UPI00386C03AD|nr:hypothetical protein OHA42_31760 [Nocardia sp. NBC_01009]